ncbi:hypothetical protein cand_005330 [Cryptosporidium andersoni]|uniref:Uncharacterized protein n=1 Tax=Cryptosporidium andersoni TaxID=117008 RepID=A0A1J4MJM7_9CRYT|nr:hypothetical protein cand_005330 [Cryptosporidium andersoni]
MAAKPLIVMINKASLKVGRYEIQCFSMGPDPQGNFYMTAFVHENKIDNFSKSLLDRIFSESLYFNGSSLRTSRGYEFIEYLDNITNIYYYKYQIVADLRNISYNKDLRNIPVHINIGIQYFNYGIPVILLKIMTSILLCMFLTGCATYYCIKEDIIDKLESYIYGNVESNKVYYKVK